MTCGATLYQNGITNIETAEQAAKALQPLAGQYTYLLFSLGIIGTGLLAVPVLAGSASYALSESFGWREGLFYKLKQAHAFYGVIIISMCLGLLLNFTSIDPIKALIYAAVANGLVAPIVLVFIVHISGSKKIMGKHANKPAVSVLGWIITGVMIIIGLATIAALVLP
jgi:Mn2+/Fe2+ NRAMP family transporter